MKPRKLQVGLTKALLLSLIVHLLFILPKYGPSLVDRIKLSENDKKEEKVIRVKLKDRKKTKLSKKMQVVNNEERLKREKPKAARFLGRVDQNHNRQTVAKKIGIFKKAGKGKKDGVKQKVAGKNPIKKKHKAKKVTKTKSNRKKKISLADLNPISEDKEIFESDRSLAALGIKHGDQKIRGLALNNDYVEDIPLGDMTALNTVEYKFYGFYHRVRQKLEQYWGSSLRKKADMMAKTGRAIAAVGERITSLSITLDSKGNIVDIFLRSTSGVKALDDAAIESFNKAGPFPNPPSGMIKDGTAKIEWGFVVKG